MSDNKSGFSVFDWTMIFGTLISTLLCAFLFSGIGNLIHDIDWWVTTIAAVLNICCCVCSAKGNKLTFLFGSVYNILYTVYCFKTHHYGNAAVYGLCFLPLQLFGYLQWRKIGASESNSEAVAAKRLSWKHRLWILLGSILALSALVTILSLVGGQDIYVDAACTVLCVIAQLLLTFAFMEQWFIWIGVNALTLVMWGLSALNGWRADGTINISDLNLAICYAFVLINSINGLLVWLRLSKGRNV